MKVYLVRHGNTFGPGDKVVRAGSTTDYPLVEKGREQASTFARYLRQQGIQIDGIYTSSLSRTTTFAQIVADEIDYQGEIETDNRLMELDYGPWSGLSDDEIRENHNAQELDEWNTLSIWPESDLFGSDEATVVGEALAFLEALITRHKESETILAVSSNGRLRYFLRALEDEFEKRAQAGTCKVKTGHFGLLEFTNAPREWRLIEWNKSPS